MGTEPVPVGEGEGRCRFLDCNDACRAWCSDSCGTELSQRRINASLMMSAMGDQKERLATGYLVEENNKKIAHRDVDLGTVLSQSREFHMFMFK